jgi:hypothetical protein
VTESRPPELVSEPPANGAAAAPLRSGLAQAAGEQFSLEKSIGGVRGLLESVIPITIFSLVYGFDHDLRRACIAALVPSAAFATWRLWRREPVTQAVSGVIGVGIGAFLALRTGRSENFFLPSILKNVGFAVAYTVSILIRWPLVGVLLGFALGELTHWRQVPARLRAYQLATWLLVGMFVLRVVIQVPLFLAGQTTTLGFLSVPLGLPLFGVTVYLSWLVIRRVPVAHPPGHGAATAATATDHDGRA